MDVLSVWTLILSIPLLAIAYWYLTVPRNLPPGSAGVPILGYLPFAGTHVHLTLTELGKKYGNVFHLYLGSRLAIVLNDFDAIKTALVKQGDIFSGRSPDVDFEDLGGGFSGIILTDGEYWRQHRRFILHNLRDYGVGKPTLEPLILDEIQHFLKEIRKQDGKPIELKDHLSPSLANNIHILVTGKRYDYGNPIIKAVLKTFKDFEKISDRLLIATFLPWSKPIVDRVFHKRAKSLQEIKEVNYKIVKNTIMDCKSKYIDGQNEFYLQAYLTEQNNRLQINKDDKIFTEHGLIQNTLDLLGAGTDTSSSTLSWAALYMALYPDVQKRVQIEIDKVIGRQREPSYKDRINTPYTEATLCELHRVISLAPLGVVHRTTQDTTLYGYRIPKDTMVFPNIWAVHNDPKLWGDPEKFRPERFIGPKGDCLKPEYLIPFSIGKRACAGEPLARMELYLYFVSLLQNFEFCPPDGVTLSLEDKPGFTRQPISLILCAKLRK